MAKRSESARGGFTIAELLVAISLLALVVVTVADPFDDAFMTFRQMKGVGDLQERPSTEELELRTELLATATAESHDATRSLLADSIVGRGFDVPAALVLAGRYRAHAAEAAAIAREVQALSAASDAPAFRAAGRHAAPEIRRLTREILSVAHTLERLETDGREAGRDPMPRRFEPS